MSDVWSIIEEAQKISVQKKIELASAVKRILNKLPTDDVITFQKYLTELHVKQGGSIAEYIDSFSDEELVNAWLTPTGISFSEFIECTIDCREISKVTMENRFLFTFIEYVGFISWVIGKGKEFYHKIKDDPSHLKIFVNNKFPDNEKLYRDYIVDPNLFKAANEVYSERMHIDIPRFEDLTDWNYASKYINKTRNVDKLMRIFHERNTHK